mmetsp:Transcript_105823/g.194073  ORF Transcript_105823/g.194073 Transcript_105823/m.194073 type:complete len:729 (+) Transcript_105823:60-2246(+)
MTMRCLVLVLAFWANGRHALRVPKRSAQPTGLLLKELENTQTPVEFKVLQPDMQVGVLQPLKTLASFLVALTNPGAAQTSEQADTAESQSQTLAGSPIRAKGSIDRVFECIHPSISFALKTEETAGAEDWRHLASKIASLQHVDCAVDLMGALESMLEEAEKGDALAMAALGTVFVLGHECGLKQNLTWGMHWLKRAADEGQADAQALMGFLHESDALHVLYGYTAFKADKKTGSKLLERAAAAGSLYASMAMGHRYSYGVGVSQQLEVGVVLYEQAAALAVAALDEERIKSVEQSNPVDFDHLTLLAPSMPTDERIDKSQVEYLDYSARAGDLQGMLQMGYLYHMGSHGVPRDREAARNWFQSAADKGEPQGLANLGMMQLRAGEYNDAVKSFRRAAKRNDLSGWAGLGYAFLYGAGLPQSDKLAAKSIWKAACIGHLDSIHNLGVLALQGRGIPQSLQLALRYFVVAAEFGHPQSQLHVGRLSSRGLGLRKDSGTAQFFLKQATEAGPLVRSILSTGLRAHEEKRPQRALIHYMLAAHAGIKAGQYNAGYLFQNAKQLLRKANISEEVAQDKAMYYYDLAAMQGSTEAKVHLANLLVEREEYKDAIEQYEDAARDGNNNALWHLGYQYWHGRGLEKNRGMAWAMFQAAGMSKDVQLKGLEGLCFSIARCVYENRALITFGSMLAAMFANGFNPFDIISQVQAGLNQRVTNDDVWTGGDDDFGSFAD